MDSSTIRVLYENVLHDDVQANRIKESDIRTAINNMKEVYKPDPTSLQSEVVHVAHYNDAAHRCAYLHKYAPLHTALVSEMLQLAMMHNAHIFQAIVNKHGCFNVCSLGGGPGNDVIAVLDVLHSVLGYFEVNATIVDIMVGWKYTFESILRELQDGDYGPISEHCSEQYLSWSYEEANLLSKMTSGSNKAIASANLITMVKFVSASSCKDTSTMIGKIFRSMKQGALVLYIDNAGGGFHQLVTQEAAACNLISVFGPLKHYLYSNVDFDVKRFGYTPCLETTITIHLLRKPLPAECSDSFYYNSSYLDSHTVTGVVSKPSNNPQRRSRSQSRSRHQNKRGPSGSRGQSSSNGNPKRSQSQPRVSNGSSTNKSHNSRKTLLDNRQPGTINIPSKVANGIKNSTKYQPNTKQPGATNKYTSSTNNANALRKAQLDSKTMPAAQSRSSTSTPVDNYLHTRGTYSALSNTNFPIYSQPTAQRNSAYCVSPGTAYSTAPTVRYQQQPATPRPVATNDGSWSDNNCCCIIS